MIIPPIESATLCVTVMRKLNLSIALQSAIMIGQPTASTNSSVFLLTL